MTSHVLAAIVGSLITVVGMQRHALVEARRLLAPRRPQPTTRGPAMSGAVRIIPSTAPPTPPGRDAVRGSGKPAAGVAGFPQPSRS